MKFLLLAAYLLASLSFIHSGLADTLENVYSLSGSQLNQKNFKFSYKNCGPSSDPGKITLSIKIF